MSIIDNYGIAWSQAATLTLSAISSDAQEPIFEPLLRVLDGRGEIEVFVTPMAGLDTALTLTASLEVEVADAASTATVTLSAMSTVEIKAVPADELTLRDAAGDSMIALVRPAAGEAATAMLTLKALAEGQAAYFDGEVTVETSIVSGTGTVTAMPSALNMISAGGEAIDVEIAFSSDVALVALVRVTAGELEATATISVPAAAPRLATLLLNGELDLTQTLVRQPVMVTLVLSALDQFGAPIRVDTTLTLTAVASEGATIAAPPETLSELSLKGVELSFMITPNEDADAVVTLEVSVGGIAATAAIAVAAVDRELEALELRSISAALTQNLPEDDLTAIFELNGIDNYGDRGRVAVAAATITLSVTLSPANAAMATPLEAPSALTATGTLIAVELTEFNGEDFELTLLVEFERDGAAALEVTASVSVDAAESSRVSALELSAGQTVFMLRGVGSTLTVSVDLRLLDQYGAGIEQPKNFELELLSQVVAGDLTVIDFKRSTTTAIPKAGTSLTLTLQLDQNMDASVILRAAGMADGVALGPAELTLQTRIDPPVPQTLT